jgi:hypothetical protein
MNAPKPYLRAIAANLSALHAILTTGLQDINHGIEAAEQNEQNGAVGSIIPLDELLKQASVLVQAILILHRQS